MLNFKALSFNIIIDESTVRYHHFNGIIIFEKEYFANEILPKTFRFLLRLTVPIHYAFSN